MKLLKMKFNLN